MAHVPRVILTVAVFGVLMLRNAPIKNQRTTLAAPLNNIQNAMIRTILLSSLASSVFLLCCAVGSAISRSSAVIVWVLLDLYLFQAVLEIKYLEIVSLQTEKWNGCASFVVLTIIQRIHFAPCVVQVINFRQIIRIISKKSRNLSY